MKEFDITEYNKMCAEFLGFKTNRERSRWWYKLDDNSLFATAITGIHGGWLTELLKFNSDWNWIMEVCTKINSINVFKNNPSDTTLATIKEEMRTYLGLSNKEAVVKAIWEFINYHKENKE